LENNLMEVDNSNITLFYDILVKIKILGMSKYKNSSMTGSTRLLFSSILGIRLSYLGDLPLFYLYVLCLVVYF